MEIPEPLPMVSLLKSTWQTRKKLFSIQSHFSLSVMGPPGPIEFGLTLPSMAQDPAKVSSFLCSGPGLGMGIWAAAAAARVKLAIRMMAILFIELGRRSGGSSRMPGRLAARVKGLDGR